MPPSSSARIDVSFLLLRLHDGTELRTRKIYEETVREVYHAFSELCFLFV